MLRIYKEQSRGRPRAGSKFYAALLISIFLIARKHDLDPTLLVEAFVEAWRHKNYHCGRLKISRREVNQDFVTFLITNEEKVVAQFPVTLEILRNPDAFKNRIQDIPVPHLAKRQSDQRQKKISELRSGMRGVDVKAKIIEIPPVKAVTTRWGGQAYVSNVMIADETGFIRLSLWNNQIDTVHFGDEVEIKNCYVASFAGEPQLRPGKKGTISVIDQTPSHKILS